MNKPKIRLSFNYYPFGEPRKASAEVSFAGKPRRDNSQHVVCLGDSIAGAMNLLCNSHGERFK